MSRIKARQCVEALGITCLESDAHGILIGRNASEMWRVYTGGGIAGNSDSAWLAPVLRKHGTPRGPFWNKAQLTRALRAWRKEH